MQIATSPRRRRGRPAAAPPRPSAAAGPPRRRLGALAVLIAAAWALAAALAPPPAGAQPAAGAAEAPPRPTAIRTESPRETLQTFARLTDEMETAVLAYQRAPSLAGLTHVALLSDQLVSLIDLDAVPAASRRETGVLTFSLLMDIFGRIGLPDPALVPDVDDVEAAGEQTYRIPQTPLRLLRMPEGEREGEWLFAASTVQVAPRVAATVADLPLRTRLDTDNLTHFGQQLTGPLVPSALVAAMPEPLKRLWLDTPIWKVIATLAVLVLAGLLLRLVQRGIWALHPPGRATGLLARALLPLALLGTATVLLPFATAQLNISGRFAAIVETTATVVEYLAHAWLLWLAVRLVFEWMIRSPRVARDGLAAEMLRLASITLGFVGATVVLAFGGQAVGLPVLSVVAGLGIGGLAVALAVRPTLENLIGGVILYVDRPVKIGDFCSFGDQMGTVEGIGLRSTKLRALDRTLISIPNAQFADMQIVNWAECDEMLINETIGVRHETTPDQLRYLLAELRRMLHAHPRINSDTVRVRFAGYGPSELKINLRVYAATREWNDFFAIREDVYFRILDIVRRAGSGLAYPSQTLYLSRDAGLDAERGEAAEDAVRGWRRSGRLPFPRLTREELDRLEGTLDYPPKGSPEAGREEEPPAVGGEPLSAAPEVRDETGPETRPSPPNAVRGGRPGA